MLRPSRPWIGGLIFAALMPLAARAQDCPAAPMPEVTLERAEDPVEYDFLRNRSDLNQMGAKILAASRAGSTMYVGGLTNGTIQSDMSTDLQTLMRPATDSACLWIANIHIKLHYKPIVYVSREFTVGSCYRAAVLEHEHKHVVMDETLMGSFGAQLQQAIQMAAQTDGHLGPIRQEDLPDVSRKIQAVLEHKLNEMMDQLSTEREVKQTQIDTPEEYRRVQALCSNWP